MGQVNKDCVFVFNLQPLLFVGTRSVHPRILLAFHWDQQGAHRTGSCKQETDDKNVALGRSVDPNRARPYQGTGVQQFNLDE